MLSIDTYDINLTQIHSQFKVLLYAIKSHITIKSTTPCNIYYRDSSLQGLAMASLLINSEISDKTEY